MPTLLAIDTSSEGCSVAIHSNGHTISHYLDSPRQHTQKTLPTIDQLLSQAALSVKDLDGIVYGRGPGSFTGLRIGLGMAQGLGYSRDVPLYGVSSLLTMAQEALSKFDMAQGDVLLTTTDARMDEIYWCLYSVEGDCLAPLLDEQLSDAATLCANPLVQSSQLACLLGSGHVYPPLQNLSARHCEPVWHPKAEFMIPSALRAFEEGLFVQAEQAELTYLRDSVAWKKRERIRQHSL